MDLQQYKTKLLVHIVLDLLTTELPTEELVELGKQTLFACTQDPGSAAVKDDEVGSANRGDQCRALRGLLEAHGGPVDPLATIQSLGDRFGFSEGERNLVRFLHLYQSTPALENYLDSQKDPVVLRIMERLTGMAALDLYKTMDEEGVFFRLGLAHDRGHVLRLARAGIEFGLSDITMKFLDSNGEESLAALVLTPDHSPHVPLEHHGLDQVTLQAARAALSLEGGPTVLLIHGKPGTGKTEFARGISRACGYTPCFMKHDRRTGKRHFSDLILASHLIDRAGEVIVVDEADAMLNIAPGLFGSPDEDAPKKSQINEFLDNMKARVIFITNDMDRIPDSILRRCTFHLGFDDFSQAQRARIWTTLANEAGLFTPREIQTLALRYKANPSQVRTVCTVCASARKQGATDQELFILAGEMLGRHNEIMYQIPRTKTAAALRFGPGFVNLSQPVQGLVETLGRWQATQATRERGISILFHGAPGTGKTALAAWLAEELGLNAVVRRPSDLLSKYVGGSEKAIRQAFREAEGAMLVIDEADSLIADRPRLQHSWERTMTTEFLTCMDDFRGIFVATTNYLDNLDKASLRRFTIKVEFRPPTREQREEMVRWFFPRVDFSEAGAPGFDTLGGLTPGDVAVAARRLEVRDRLSAQEVLEALQEEVGIRRGTSGRIGFC